MTEEPKDVRLPFMVTASEAKAIDEWRYANRIPSRAEAMRILMAQGMAFDGFADCINDLFELMTELPISPDQYQKLLAIAAKDIKIRHNLFHFKKYTFEGIHEKIAKLEKGHNNP